MALFAITVPILPGKTTQWKQFAAEFKGPRKREFEESRRRLGVRERVFLQSTPQGDVVVVTLEGDNPEAAFRAFGQGNDEFTRWFVEKVKELHAFDLSQPMPGPIPELVLDSGSQAQSQAA